MGVVIICRVGKREVVMKCQSIGGGRGAETCCMASGRQGETGGTALFSTGSPGMELRMLAPDLYQAESMLIQMIWREDLGIRVHQLNTSHPGNVAWRYFGTFCIAIGLPGQLVQLIMHVLWLNSVVADVVNHEVHGYIDCCDMLEVIEDL